MNKKLWFVLNHLVPIAATISMATTNHFALALAYFGVYVLAHFFRSQEERKREQHMSQLLDLNQLCSSTTSVEERRIHHIIYGTGLSAEEFRAGLDQLAGITASKPSPLKKCGNCKYYHGKNGIVCAVHPGGYEGDSCADFEPKP